MTTYTAYMTTSTHDTVLTHYHTGPFCADDHRCAKELAKIWVADNAEVRDMHNRDNGVLRIRNEDTGRYLQPIVHRI